MAYGFRPIAGDVKLANLGQVYAQNQQAQMQMDNNALQQQSTLATLAQAQQEQQRKQQAQELVSQQGFDINNPQAAMALANLNPELFKALSEGKKAQAEREYREAQTGDIAVDNARADIIANSTVQNQSFDNQIKAQNLQISRGQLAARQNELRSIIGEQETKAFMEVNALVAAALPEQRAAVAQQAMQLLQNRFPNVKFAKFNANEDLADMVALGTALNNKNAKSGTTVNINQSSKYLDELGKGSAQQDLSAINSAKEAPDQIKTAQSVIDIVNQGNVITGTGAEARVSIAKAFATAGLISGESVAATAQLQASLARQTLDSIISSNLGSGQGFSNADREFLEKAAAGGINLTGDSIIKIAELNIKAATASYAKGQEAINRIGKTEGGVAALGGYQLPELSTNPQGGMQQAPQAGGQAPALPTGWKVEVQ